ncbi:hypothetical protein SK128_016521 [Halocaridina rubra]|uniref:Uncharacterized protein n=1 Tax=Halocaridina rubra TaxID=373956 RepID=A0AAN8WV58_HALRR
MNDWGYNGRVALGGEIAESTVRKHDWGVCEDRSPALPESAKEIYDRNRETYGPGIEKGEKGQEVSHFLNHNIHKLVFRTQVHAQEKMPNNPSPEHLLTCDHATIIISNYKRRRKSHTSVVAYAGIKETHTSVAAYCGRAKTPTAVVSLEGDNHKSLTSVMTSGEITQSSYKV